MNTNPTQLSKTTKSREIFAQAPQIQKDLVRSILGDEREQMHLQVRREIYLKLVDHVRRLVK